jgi:hypothetical protein
MRVNTDAPQIWAEKRSAPRYEVRLRIDWRASGVAHEGALTTLSTGGCFIETSGVVGDGALVIIGLRLPAGGHILLRGTVVYQIEGLGFALQFSPSNGEEERKKLGWLVMAEERRNRTASRK